MIPGIRKHLSSATHQAHVILENEAFQRVAPIALLYLKLYKPIGVHLFAITATTQGWSNLNQLIKDFREGHHFAGCTKVLSGAIFVTSVILSKMGSRYGQFLSFAYDGTWDTTYCIVALYRGKYGLAADYFSRSVSDGVSFASVWFNSPYLILASMTLQALRELGIAAKEVYEGRFFEAIAFLVLSAIHGKEIQDTYLFFKEEERLTANILLRNLLERLRKGKDAAFLKNHPLSNLSQYLQEKTVVLKNSILGLVNFGAHIHGLGGGVVKGMNIRITDKTIDKVDVTEVEFKVNHAFRQGVEDVIEELKQIDEQDFKDCLKHAGISPTDMKIETVAYQYFNKKDNEFSSEDSIKIGDVHEVRLEGIGKVSVGATPKFLSLYDRVTVHIPAGQEASRVHFLLSFIGLDQAMKPSTAEDFERLKIGQLFHVYHPREALRLERSKEFFDLPLSELKDKMVALAPEMGDHLLELPLMVPEETLPNRIRYSIPNLAVMAKSYGAGALISGIGAFVETEKAYLQAASILQTGAFSSQTRFDLGLGIHGLASVRNHKHGSADEVFTRLVFVPMENEEPLTISEIPFSGAVQMVYSLDLLNQGTYQYHGDDLGMRMVDHEELSYNLYKDRQNLEEFIQTEKKEFGRENEVMIKDTIAPKNIVGCIVPDAESKQAFVEVLRHTGVIENQEGQEFIRSIPVDDFIHVGTQLTSQMLNQNP